MSLKGVAQQTLSILDAGEYAAPSGALRSLQPALARAIEGTVLVTPDGVHAALRRVGPGGPPPQLELWEATTQVCARRLVQDEGVVDPFVLNFASARNPGGGFLSGAKAQEEDVTRCSGLYPCLLTQPTYYEVNRAQRSMLYTDHLIYSPRVPFFRERSRSVLEHPFEASVLTAPAPNAGEYLRRGGDPGELDETLRRRAGGVLAVARQHGHRVLLLGAWGCGVFRNDPARVADAFDHWLRHPVFAGCFERVVFGVIDGSHDQHVLAAFRARFA
jgi:uncharacterized protein (TIGR02452 family)